MGMIQNDREIVIFGGENTVHDSDKTFALVQSGSKMSLRETGRLPEPCAPACTSYVLNNTNFYYFLSNEGKVFRYNKMERLWARW